MLFDWFDVEDDVPFMMKVFPIRKDKHETIPAVTHADGMVIQTVFEETNPRYYALIKALRNELVCPSFSIRAQ